ncbi:MAG: hypothetical protein ABIP94_19395 [Planctomycetota bacterium]
MARETGAASCRAVFAIASDHPQRIDVGTTRNDWVVADVLTLGVGFAIDFALDAHRDPITDPLVVRLGATDDPPPAAWARPVAQSEPIDPPVDCANERSFVASVFCALAAHQNR